GIPGGANFVKYFEGVYFIYGIIMTTIPMIAGYLFAKYVLKLSLLNNLGSITGGMTSTPALGTLINTAGTEDVASAYASTYPVALISVVIVSKVLIMMFN
ncbi:MAG: permease, partial [Treponema sp.]|nr:permease [Treponema sp.]